MNRLATLAALLLAAPLWGQQAVIVAPAKVSPGDLVVLDGSQSKGTGHVWKLVSSDKTFLPVDGGVKCVFATGAPGLYSFVLAVADGGKADLAVHVLQVGEAIPPVPPVPPPTPIDPLWGAMQAAYGADLSATKATQARQLASVYRVAAATTVNNPALTTAGMLYDAVATAAASVVPLPALQGVRQALAEDFRKNLPTALAAPLDTSLRVLCRDNFNRAATLLEALTK